VEALFHRRILVKTPVRATRDILDGVAPGRSPRSDEIEQGVTLQAIMLMATLKRSSDVLQGLSE
jgi:hypothetical protein